jgi:8-oxo-dGTP pyrophosphatase MutT (NUDIX family)
MRSVEQVRLHVGENFFQEMSRRLPKSTSEVVMVIRRPGGRALISTKRFYPEGLYRLPTGKIKLGEDPEVAFLREAFEETGFEVIIEQDLGKLDYEFAHKEMTTEYSSHVFVSGETKEPPVPTDEREQITGYREIDLCGLDDLAKELNRLPEPWTDWGRFRAVAHDFVFRKLCV